jgi:hypothetical protein
VLVYEVLGWRGWDSKHNRTPVSAHRRGRHRGEQHKGMIHGSSCWEHGSADMWQCEARLSSSELGKKPERAGSKSYYLWCKEYAWLYHSMEMCRGRTSAEPPASGEECSRVGVVELMTSVAMNSFDGVAKLCGDKGETF